MIAPIFILSSTPSGYLSLPLVRDCDKHASDTVRQDFIENMRRLFSESAEGAIDYSDFGCYHADLQVLLEGIFVYSPHLSQALLREGGIFVALCENGGKPTIEAIMSSARNLLSRCDIIEDADVLMVELRRLKRQLSLVLGLLDLCGGILLSDLTDALSDLAEISVRCALAHMWQGFHRRGYIEVDSARAEGEAVREVVEPRGIFVLGLGKFGGHELNYSSDIDLLLLFDSERLPFVDEHRSQAQEILNRGVRQFVNILDTVNRDGFVFRVDLELRPDPLSTPPIVSVESALNYYASVGQTWERAAYIKARHVAGDEVSANFFLNELAPFIWRKNLDYYALNEIADIRSRMLTSKKISCSEGIRGFNVKLSFGGIREIEFLTQSQQLIWGGRNIFLRCVTTLDSLHRIIGEGILPRRVGDPLVTAYTFLRQVEHRLQMQMNQQTQTLPGEQEGLEAFARFCGFATIEAFVEVLEGHVEGVRCLSDEFGPKKLPLPRRSEDASGVDTSSQFGDLFASDKAGEASRDFLQKYQFKDCERAHNIINQWLGGHYRSTRSEKSLTRLSALLPTLLQHCQDSTDADETLLQFDKFLRKLPFGVQFFSLLQAHPHLCQQLFAILGGAPTIGHWLSSHPHLLDVLLESEIALAENAEATDDNDSLKAVTMALNRAAIGLKETLGGADKLLLNGLPAHDLQDILNITIHWVNDQKFLWRVYYFNGSIGIRELMHAETLLAEKTLEALLPAIIDDYNAGLKRRGKLSQAGSETPFRGADRLVTVAFGKFGYCELLPLSDLDLVFIFDAAVDEDIGCGQLAMTYYVRLCQRILTALSLESGEGKLYSVDIRLRPSGNKGAIATPIDRFIDYYKNGEAWTWEFMSLLKARAIAGGREHREKIMAMKRELLGIPRDRDKIISDLREMWERTRAEHKGDSEWDVKYRRGGLQDVEYVIHALQLLHVHAHPCLLDIVGDSVIDVLCEASILTVEQAQELRNAYILWMNFSAALKLLWEGEAVEEAELTEPQIGMLVRVLNRSCGCSVSNLGEIKALMERTASEVQAQFDALFVR